MGHHYGYVSEQLITGGVLPPRRERRRRARRPEPAVDGLDGEAVRTQASTPRAAAPSRPAGTRPRPSTG